MYVLFCCLIVLDRSRPCHQAKLRNIFFLFVLVLPGKLTTLSMIMISLILLACQPNQMDAQRIVQRINYGVVFVEEAPVHIAAENWLHTFQLPIPKRSSIPRLGTCHKDNNTCLLIGQLLAQINTLRTETALRLNNTIRTVRRLVPEAKIQKSRSARSLLPFIGQFSKTLFGTATLDDVNTLAKHINALSKKTNELGQALTQHGAHFSSFISSANKRMDNLMKGIQTNEMAIKYVQTQIQTFASNIQTTFTHMNDLLITQLEHSNHLNHELEEFKLGIIDLVEGKLSPLLIQPEHIKAAFHDIQKLLNRNYPGFGLAYQDIQNVYSSGNFLFARNNSNIYITIKLPLTYRPKPLSLYKLSTIPVPINETSTHATTLLNLPPFFLITDDSEYYASLSELEISKCYGKPQLYCPFNLALRPATSQSCELGLFTNNKQMVHSFCDFRFLENTILPKLVELNPTTILVYRISLLSLECGQNQKMITGCDFCLMQVPCMCSITTTQFYLKPRLVACQNESRNITKLHPINLGLLQEFFDPAMTEHIYADTTFQKPLNVSTPAFQIYDHEMNQVLADDTKAHLNLRKMADKAKNDEIIFKSLSEPMLDGQIAINSEWPDFNAILIFISGGLAVCASLALLWMFFKIRSLSAAILILQQGKAASALSTQLPSFIYKQVTESTGEVSSFTLDITLQWDHAIFLLNLFILAVSFIVLLKVYRNYHSHIPWLCAEITSINDCILVPLVRLPLCPAHCHIQVPSTISNLSLQGSWFSPVLQVCWSDFYIFNDITGQRVKVPEKIELSFFHYLKLRKLLHKSFFIHVYISHNGLLQFITPRDT